MRRLKWVQDPLQSLAVQLCPLCLAGLLYCQWMSAQMKRVWGVVELSGHITGWRHVLQWHFYSWNKTGMPLPTTQWCCVFLVLKELGRSCCALEHPGLWELPAVYSRDNGKILKLQAPLGKSLPTSGKWRQTKSSFPVPCSLLAPVDLGIWWGLLWPSSPSLSQRQILASWVRKSLDSRWPQGSALPWQRDAVSQLFDAIFQLSEAAASCPTCLSVLQESQGNSSSHYISESCLSDTPLMS